MLCLKGQYDSILQKIEGVFPWGTCTLPYIVRMEGANGRILDTEDPKVVIKKVHRRNRAHYRTGSLGAEEQMRRQEAARKACESSGFKMLFIPKAWGAERFSYKMDRIQVDKPLEVMDAKTHPVFEELKQFYAMAKAHGTFPADYELYIQSDGRVAMVDFDKFGDWRNGEVVFPWGQVSKVKDLLEPLGLFLA